MELIFGTGDLSAVYTRVQNFRLLRRRWKQHEEMDRIEKVRREEVMSNGCLWGLCIIEESGG